MAQSAQTQSRNEKLDELQEAFNEWYEKEKSRLEGEVSFLKSVLKGRTGSERLSNENVVAAGELVSTDITSFLAGL